MPRRSPAAALCLALGLAGAGCSEVGEPRIQRPTPSLAPSSAGTPSPASSPSTSAADEDPTAALQGVLRRVRDAGSVRLAVGNLNPPPTTFLLQDYARPEGDVELRVEILPGEPVLTVRRVDGAVVVSEDGEEFTPAPPIGPDDTSLVSRVLRTTPADELGALLGSPARADSAPDLVGEVEGASAAYRLLVATDELTRPHRDAFASVPWRGLPDRLPVTLWLDGAGFPLRLEAKYAEPLNGIEGTGAVRIDYSGWGDPVDLDSP